AAVQRPWNEALPPEETLLAGLRANWIEVEIADLRNVGRLAEAVDAAVLVAADDDVAAVFSVDVRDQRTGADVEIRRIDEPLLVPPDDVPVGRIERDDGLRLLADLRSADAVPGRDVDEAAIAAHRRAGP